MKLKVYERFKYAQRDLARAVRVAYRRHGSVRAAADSLGMPRATFHDYLQRTRGHRCAP